MNTNLNRRWTLNCKLLLAIQNSDVTTASKLFSQGIDTDIRFCINSQKRPAICLSVENNDMDMVELMLELGASVNQKDSNDQTPLHITSDYGYVSMTKLLLHNRADIHSKNSGGQTPLHRAVKTGKSDLVDLLLHYGADVNSVDQLGQTCLHHAAHGSPSHIIETLLSYGADIWAEDKHGNMALHFAVDILGTSLEGIASLLEANPFAVLHLNGRKRTPLHLIITTDRKDEELVVRTMLTALSLKINVTPNLLSPRTEKGHTPLHLAVLEKKVDLVRILIASGAEVDTRDQLGRTPLECAVRDSEWSIVALLLAAGASVRGIFGEEWLLTQIKDDINIEMLTKAASCPMDLSSLCRRVISRKFGYKIQRALSDLPLSWRQFLCYENL